MIDLNRLLPLISPFPVRTQSGGDVDGILYSRSPMCASCLRRECSLALSISLTGAKVCDNGGTYFRFSFQGRPFVIFGLITELSIQKISRKLREKMGKRIVQSPSVIKWIEGLSKGIAVIEKEAQDISVESLEAFHDVLPSISLLQRDVERVIQKGNGTSFEQKLKSAPPEIRDLFKSMSILKERINLMPLLTNPEWPTLGGKRGRHVYKLVDTLARSFRVLAREKRITIKLSGNSRNTPRVYTSFSAIPFVLLDNAVKYSLKEQDIDISVNDCGSGGVEIAVQSSGPIVPSELRLAIFDKKFRYSPPGLDSPTGSGLGLYLANIVAKAHGFSIDYNAKFMHLYSNAECGINTFSFKIS